VDQEELGDVDHMLSEPDYVSDGLFMTAALQQDMINYYNFLTAYEDLLRNGETANSNVIDLPGGPATSTNGSTGLDLRQADFRHRCVAVHQHGELDK
jgi:dextranase